MRAMENEITGAVALCNADGTLNPAAVGWGKHPVWDCNLAGRWGRKKRWDYWCFMGPERLFSLCLAHIDYIGLCGAYVVDYATGHMAECGMALPFARAPKMPRDTYGESEFRWGRMRMAQSMGAEGGVLTVSGARMEGKPFDAEFRVELPVAQETLNVVVPWNARTFQFTSKQLPLAAEGEVRWGDETWRFDKASCFGVRDFGRGIWPIATTWNWAALSGQSGGQRYGVNLGGRWTDGTGATENGLMVDGQFWPIADEARWEYDARDFMKPWRLYTRGAAAVDLAFAPFFERVQRVNLGLLKMEVHQCFGRFTGTVRVGGQEVEVQEALGWAEEQQARW